METLFTRENITLAIALFGAIGTIATWIVTAFHSRKKVTFRIVKIYPIKKTLTLYLSIQNRSRLPISIDSMSIVIENVSYHCQVPPHVIFTVTHRSGQTITDKKDYISINFPINLSSLGGASGYIEFDIPQEVSKKLSTPLILEVSTNRGKLPKTELSFQNFSDLDELL